MASAFFVSVIVAVLGLACAAQPLQRQISGDPFSLYAYGDNINGLEVFYADGECRPMSEMAIPLTSSTGKAQMGDQSVSNATNKVSMYNMLALTKL